MHVSPEFSNTIKNLETKLRLNLEKENLTIFFNNGPSIASKEKETRCRLMSSFVVLLNGVFAGSTR